MGFHFCICVCVECKNSICSARSVISMLGTACTAMIDIRAWAAVIYRRSGHNYRHYNDCHKR